ncbi:MAG: hypothetical protein QM731_10205 [Chitinophagaceae bacterium]
MSNDLLNILSNSNKDIDNQKLMDYLSGTLSDQDKHEVEAWMLENDFANDAIEGLEQVDNSRRLETLVDQLNRDLHNKLQQKNERKAKRKLKEYPWIYFAVILVLILVVLAFFVIHYLQRVK